MVGLLLLVHGPHLTLLSLYLLLPAVRRDPLLVLGMAIYLLMRYHLWVVER